MLPPSPPLLDIFCACCDGIGMAMFGTPCCAPAKLFHQVRPGDWSVIFATGSRFYRISGQRVLCLQDWRGPMMAFDYSLRTLALSCFVRSCFRSIGHEARRPRGASPFEQEFELLNNLSMLHGFSMYGFPMYTLYLEKACTIHRELRCVIGFRCRRLPQ